MDPETLSVSVSMSVSRAFCPVEPGPALMSSTALTWRCCLWWLNRFSPYREVCPPSSSPHPSFLIFFWLITPGNQRQICHFSIKVKSLQSSGQTAGLQPQLCSLLSGSVASKHAGSSQQLHEFNCLVFFSTKCTASVFLVSFHNVNLWHR